MKFNIKSTILLLVNFSLVRGLSPDVPQEYDGTMDTSRRVISGETADPAKLQFMVRLLADNLLCGGSVISNYFILTAGHCIVNKVCNRIKINPSNWKSERNTKFHPVQCYIHEKNVAAVNFYYDIALIKTSTSLLEDKNIKLISLPAPGTRYPAGTPAVIAGWGRTENGTYPGRLLRGNVVVIDWNTCKNNYSHEIPKKALCTGYSGSSKTGVCFGDSGGPVIINNVLAAVITGTQFTPKHDCKIGSPSLHLSVSEFLPWIYSIIEPDRDTSKYSVITESY